MWIYSRHCSNLDIIFSIYDICRVAPTYETASTRQFYHGRTDTVKMRNSNTPFAPH